MTLVNRVQTLRSSVSGNLPTAGTRQPGELWVNFADSALGFIDSTQTAQKLLGVRLFVTSANYAIGDFVVQGGNLYCAIAPSMPGGFNSANWTKIGTAQDLAQYLPLAGGTLTGPLTLSGPPTQPLQAATKAYVDSGSFLPISGGTLTGPLILAADPTLNLGAATKQYADGARYGDNRLINGDMLIDQRNNGASGTAAGYTVDRWQYATTQANRGTWQRNTNNPAPVGFPYGLLFTSSSAFTPAAGDTFGMVQSIEADMISDFAWGTSNAQPVTLSFWAYSSLTGTFSGSIRNYANTRSYPFVYSIPVSGVWTRIVITIPGDTGGTWVLSGNAGALNVGFDLGTGTTYRGPANEWAGTQYNGVSGAINVVATASAIWIVTGVKLEIGTVVTPFNRQSLAKTLVDCQRYYQAISNYQFAGYGAGAGYVQQPAIVYPVQMRAAPSASFNNLRNTQYTTAVNGSPFADLVQIYLSVNTAGTCYGTADIILSAEL